MELNKKYIVAGTSLILIVIMSLILFCSPEVGHLIPRQLYEMILLSFPLLVLILLIIAVIALMIGKSDGITNSVSIIVILAIIAGIFVPILFFEAFIHNQGQGNIEYTITITGLEGKTGNYISDVIVPLPIQNGESLIPVEEIDGRTFGEWRAIIIGFPDNDDMMLAFQHGGTNLTDIEAKFYQYLPDGLIVNDENKVHLSPALDGLKPLKMAGRYAWSLKEPIDYNYSSMISLPTNIEDRSESMSDEINFNIQLRVNTGKTGFMTISKDYRFSIIKSLNLNSSGFIPVNVSVHAAE